MERKRQDVPLTHPKKTSKSVSKRPKSEKNPKGTCQISERGWKTCQAHLRHKRTRGNTWKSEVQAQKEGEKPKKAVKGIPRAFKEVRLTSDTLQTP